MDRLEAFEKACAITESARKEALKLVRPGVRAEEVADRLEALMVELGGKPAFPVNVSLNDTAAHYAPELGDPLVFGEKDLVKIDLGAQVDGYPGDAAVTVDLSGENGKLVEASERALETAIAMMKAGAQTRDIGAEVEKVITDMGFRPIENLTGHSLGRYDLHAGVSIPNIRTPHSYELKEGDVFAVEPFATTGAGHVSETSKVLIFMLQAKKPTRLGEARRMLDYIDANFSTLPFAERWLYREFRSKVIAGASLRELIKNGSLHQYPVLKEIGKGLISQAEATVIIEKDSARVLTR